MPKQTINYEEGRHDKNIPEPAQRARQPGQEDNKELG